MATKKDNNLIGDSAEAFVLRQLQDDGYKVARFGYNARQKGSRAELGNIDPVLDIPIMGIKDLRFPYDVYQSPFAGKNALHILNEFRKSKLKNPDFLVKNFLVNEFIARYYSKHCDEEAKKGRPPHSFFDYGKDLESKNKKKREAAERCRDENIAWRDANIAPFPGGGSHPGKYDFIAFKGGAFSAVEVKANTSRLSYWQEVRLGLLKQLGESIMVIKVKVGDDNNASDMVINHGDTLVSPLSVSDALFLEVVQYVAKHELVESTAIALKDMYKSIIA